MDMVPPDSAADPTQVTVDVGAADRLLGARSAGRGHRVAILLESGGSSPALCWQHLEVPLSVFAHVISYDRAGYGLSTPVRAHRTFDEMAADLTLVVDALHPSGPVILVGASMGGLIVRKAAALLGDRLAGCLLLDAVEEQHVFSRLAVMKRMLIGARASSWLARTGLIRLMLYVAGERAGIPKFLPRAQRDGLLRECSSSRFFETVVHELAAYFRTPSEQRVSGGFGRLDRVPLIVVTHGKARSGLPNAVALGWAEAQKRLAALAEDSELIEAPRSGHAIAFGQPELVVDLCQRLCNRVEAGTID